MISIALLEKIDLLLTMQIKPEKKTVEATNMNQMLNKKLPVVS